MTLPLELMLKPGGRAPETSTNSYGGQPARATNWKLYGVPTLPLVGKTLSSKPNAMAVGTAIAATTARIRKTRVKRIELLSWTT